MGGKPLAFLAMASLGALTACGTTTHQRDPVALKDPFAEVPRAGCGEERRRETVVGELLRQSCTVQAHTNQDVGRVWIDFEPPSLNDVMRPGELDDNWKNRFRRFFGQNVRSATVLMDVYLRAGAVERQIATVPLATYSFSEADGVELTTTQAFRRGLVTPAFSIDEQLTTVAVRTRVEFSRQTQSDIVGLMNDIVGAAADFGGHGWMVNAFSNEETRTRLSRLERLFVGGGLSIKEENTVDLGYGPEAYQRVLYSFSLDPTNTDNGTLGLLTVQLRRFPSVFTHVNAQNSRVNFDIESSDQYEPFLNFEVTGGHRLLDFLRSDEGVSDAVYGRFMNRAPTPDEFGLACGAVWEKLARLELNSADRRALFWAAVQSSANNDRVDLWTPGGCLRAREQDSQNLGLRFPWDPLRGLDVFMLSDDRMRSFVDRRVLRALWQDPTDVENKSNWVEALFIEDRSIEVEAPQDALFAGRAVTRDQRETTQAVVHELKNVHYEAGCYFRDPERPSRVLMLARPHRGEPRDYRLTLDTLSYRVPGGGEHTTVSGIFMREATDEDFQVNAERLPQRPECHARNTWRGGRGARAGGGTGGEAPGE